MRQRTDENIEPFSNRIQQTYQLSPTHKRTYSRQNSSRIKSYR